MVHSLFTSKDDWDDELESFESGWPGFFEVLRVYLKNFPGEPAAAVRALAGHPDGEARAWSKMTTALNLAGANVGERRETPADAPRLEGVVERVHQDANSRELMIRLDEPGEGIAVIGSYRMARRRGERRASSSTAAAQRKPQPANGRNGRCGFGICSKGRRSLLDRV